MKKILSLVTLLAGFTFGASAQDTAYVTPVVLNPALTFNTCNSSDSSYVSYGFINHGPDTIQTTDTFAFSDFTTSGPGRVYVLTPSAALAPNDTFALAFNSGYVTVSNLAWLADANDTVRYSPYANGTYSGIIRWFGFTKTDSTGALKLRTDIVTNSQTAAGYDPLGRISITLNCPTTGILGATLDKATLRVFPNPAQNQISFTNNFANATATAQVRVTDIAGRIVKTMDLGKQNVGEKTFNIDINDLNNGMYYIELVTDHSRGINKFTKN